MLIKVSRCTHTVVRLTHRHSCRSEAKSFFLFFFIFLNESFGPPLWCVCERPAGRVRKRIYEWREGSSFSLMSHSVLPSPVSDHYSFCGFHWHAVVSSVLSVSDVTSCSKVVLQYIRNRFITVNLPFSAFHQLFHWVRASQNSSWQCLMFSDQLQPLNLLLTWNSWTEHWKCAIAISMH